MIAKSNNRVRWKTNHQDPGAAIIREAKEQRKISMDKTKHSIIRPIAFIGNYLPRQCGIATFTTDLCESIADEYRGTARIALPVNDTEEGNEYPARVRFETIRTAWGC
jgi:hypothetical protein